MRVLVTGASGFVGSALIRRLREREGCAVRAALRRQGELPEGVEPAVVGELSAATDWSEAVRGVDVVVHLAARVHVVREHARDPMAEFRAVNVGGTSGLAQAAAAAGVARLVFVSSIKVNGEGGRVYRASDPPAPEDAYGASKLEAEEVLRRSAAATGMQAVILRPPLVYGPGVKANFASMMAWLRRGIPLPLGAVRNRRSLVALDNLTDLIARCLDHPAAANRTWLVSDGEDLSTPELLRRLGRELGAPARLLPVPVPVLLGLARLAGRGGAARRLCGSLQVDSSSTREQLGWNPPLTVTEGLRVTARHFLGRDRP